MNTFVIRVRRERGPGVNTLRVKARCMWEAIRSLPVPVKRRVVEVVHADEAATWEALHA